MHLWRELGAKIFRSVGKFRYAPIRQLSSARINFIRESTSADMSIRVILLLLTLIFSVVDEDADLFGFNCPVLYTSLFIHYPILTFILNLGSRLTHRLRFAVPCLVWLLIATRHPPDKLAKFKIVIMNLRSKKYIVSVGMVF